MEDPVESAGRDLLSHGAAPAYEWAALVRAEYLEMPGLALTLNQMIRLWGIDRHQLTPVVDELVDRGFLSRRGDRYVRGDGASQ